MHRGTIDYGQLRMDWDSNGTLTLARQDRAECLQLSKSEWVFILKACELMGWPVAPPVRPVEIV